MRRAISNNQILTLFLGLALAVAAGGCASVPAPQSAPAAPRVESVPATPALTTAKPKAGASKPNTETAAQAQPHVAVNGVPAIAPIAEEMETASADADGGEEEDSAGNAPPPPESIWTRIRAGLRMASLDSPYIEQHEQWFVQNAEFREAMFERSKLYLYFIVEEVEKRGMPMEIALLPAIESAYKPYAYSRAKASGLWQFIPSTGRLYGLKTNWWYDGRRDVVASTRAALDYLEKLSRDFDGDWHLALAAYNAGEGRVMRARESNRRRGLPMDYASLRQLKPETKHYVPKLMAMVNIVSNPERYGIQLPEIPNEPYFTRVEADSQVDLGVIARLTGMEADDLHFINPGYTRRATDPNGPHYILVPADKKDAVLAGLSSLPEKERVQWLHHEVRRGDTLYEIARRYGLNVSAIRTANNLRSNTLRIGQDLMLPISASAKLPARSVGAAAKPVRIAGKSGQPIIHRVRRGETLSSIARRYNVLVHQIAEWNLMQKNDILRFGTKLKIWLDGGPQAFHRDPTAAPIFA